MNTKARIVLTSLADLSAHILTAAASLPVTPVGASKASIAPPARATRRELRAARRRPLELVRSAESHARTAFEHVTPWARGGINE